MPKIVLDLTVRMAFKYSWTFLTFLITSLLKKYSIKNNQKFSLCISTDIYSTNSYSPLSFNIFQRNFVLIFPNSRTTEILSENILNIIDQTLQQIISGNCDEKTAQSQRFWSFHSSKKFSDKILSENDLTHLLKELLKMFIMSGEYF